MSAYNELVKSYETVRAYLREFYVYGCKERSEFDGKSARSYDDGRRRTESWLGDWTESRSSGGKKNVFLSVDSRRTGRNPLYRTWKTKSFTDGDITLFFLLLDLLDEPDKELSLPEIVRRLDSDYLNTFPEPYIFDSSTVRKKQHEYEKEGMVVARKEGRPLLYRRAEDVRLPTVPDFMDFFSEVAPCGVIGSYLLDKMTAHDSLFTFKHHYITGAFDSEVTAQLFAAMRQKCAVRIVCKFRHKRWKAEEMRLVPLKILISVQNGKQHLLAYRQDTRSFFTLRLDYIMKLRPDGAEPQFDALRAEAGKMKAHMWGVSCRTGNKRPERISFTVTVRPEEDFIVRRLEREKRCGTVEKLAEDSYVFRADVYDANEMIPWIRTFLCRITSFSCTNRMVENRFRADLKEMYRMYGLKKPMEGDGSNDFQ